MAVRRINDAGCEPRFEDRNGLEAFQCRCNKACFYGSIKQQKKNPTEKVLLSYCLISAPYEDVRCKNVDL